jgi:membrane fusion protein, multidrug efflux system
VTSAILHGGPVPTIFRRLRILSVLALLAAAAACGRDGNAAQPQGGGGPGGPGGPGGGRRPSGPPAVETAAVLRGAIARELEVSGTVEPLRTVGVNALVSGALVAVAAEEGDFVRQGQVLARLDDREVAAQLASAQASWEVARDALARARQLRERQVITEAEYERDRAAEAAARAALDGVRTRRGYTVVRSPLTGVVTQKQVETGDVIGAQSRLFTVADLSTPVVRVGVSELEVGSLRVGQTVRVGLDAHPGQRFEGRIRRIFPSADPGTRLLPVEVALTGDAARAARPGYLARIAFALGAREGVLLVPASAVGGAAGSHTVFVVADGRAERRPVETGLSSEGRVEIVSGVQEGEAVVVTGNNNLRGDAEVRVVAGPGAAPAAERPEGPPAAAERRGGGR